MRPPLDFPDFFQDKAFHIEGAKIAEINTKLLFMLLRIYLN